MSEKWNRHTIKLLDEAFRTGVLRGLAGSWHEWRSCTGKRTYPTQGEAEMGAERLRRKKRRVHAYAYLCRYCWRYHITKGEDG